MADGEARLPRRAAAAVRLARHDAVHRAAAGADRPVAGDPRRRRRGPRPRSGAARRVGPRRVGHPALVSPGRLRPRAAAVPRPGEHRDGVARRPAARDRGDHRPSGATRAPRPARGAAPAHVRPRPPVHVAVLHARLGAAPRHRRRSCSRPACIRLWRCCSSSRCRRWSRRRGDRASSEPSRTAPVPTRAWPATCSCWARRPRRERRCGSPATATTWYARAATRGCAGTHRWPGPGGSRRSGTPSRGRCSPGRTSSRSSTRPRASTARRDRWCWCWWPAASSRSTSRRRSASWVSCAASGSTSRGG